MTVSAPNTSNVQWTFLVFTFGHLPEFWDLGPPDGSDNSSAQPPGPLVGGKGKARETSDAGPLAQLEENSAVADVEPMATLRRALDSSLSLPEPARDGYPAHVGSSHSLPNLAFETTVQATGSGGGPINTTVPAPPAASILQVPTTNSTANVSAVAESTAIDDAATLLQDQDVTTFLSAFHILKHLAGSELSTLLRDVLASEEKPEAADNAEFIQAQARLRGRLQEFKRVHGDVVKKMWGIVRHAKQWHTWGLEVQYFHLKLGIVLPPEFLSAQRELSTYTNGFTLLVIRLMYEQAYFLPSEA